VKKINLTKSSDVKIDERWHFLGMSLLGGFLGLSIFGAGILSFSAFTAVLHTLGEVQQTGLQDALFGLLYSGVAFILLLLGYYVSEKREKRFFYAVLLFVIGLSFLCLGFWQMFLS